MPSLVRFLRHFVYGLIAFIIDMVGFYSTSDKRSVVSFVSVALYLSRKLKSGPVGLRNAVWPICANTFCQS